MIHKISKAHLENLYNKYNHREFVHPDPIEFLYDYENLYDREIVGLIASSLAYGRVEQILKSVNLVLKRMPAPSAFLQCSSFESLRRVFSDFKHRFTTGQDLAAMLFGVKHIIEKYGSLYACFTGKLEEEHDSVLPALFAFIRELYFGNESTTPNTLIPLPTRGSACKRLNLFLRWMVRQDEVDPGGWSKVPAFKLIVPLDTHLHRICLSLNLTKRKQANMQTACEITSAFKAMTPEDPLRYDFVLTRLGIWKKDWTSPETFLC